MIIDWLNYSVLHDVLLKRNVGFLAREDMEKKKQYVVIEELKMVWGYVFLFIILLSFTEAYAPSFAIMLCGILWEISLFLVVEPTETNLTSWVFYYIQYTEYMDTFWYKS